MGKKFKKKLLKSTFISYLLNVLINLYLSTICIRYENEEKFLNHLENQGCALLSISHQHFFPSFKALKKYLKYNVAGIVSKSSDGDIMTAIGELNGYIGIRGSSSRGGKEAMEKMIEHLKGKNNIGAIAPDGPKGPLGIIKPGTIRIAQKSRALIFPCSAVADSAWHVNSWDKTLIPKPFSRVTMKFGSAVSADSIKTDADFENKRVQLENILQKHIKK